MWAAGTNVCDPALIELQISLLTSVCDGPSAGPVPVLDRVQDLESFCGRCTFPPAQIYLAQTPFMERFTVDWRGGSRSQSHRAVVAIQKCGLLLLTAVVALLEQVSARIFEWESMILSSTPCGVFKVQESAILILGEADGMDIIALLLPVKHGLTRGIMQA